MSNPSYDFGGRTALITGAARGIGLATAQAFARCGARVVVVDRNPETDAIAEQVLPGTPQAVSFVADVRNRRQLEGVRDSLREAGLRPDILFVNAGVNVRKPALEITDEEVRSIFDTNVYGAYATLQTFGSMLNEQVGGSVVINSSLCAIHGMNVRAPYTATKAALSGLVRSLAIEWGPLGTTVNAVGPGVIRTPLTEGYMEEFPERARAAIENTPLRRLGEPQDVADVVLFLASEGSRFITGQTIFVDGGVSAGSTWW